MSRYHALWLLGIALLAGSRVSAQTSPLVEQMVASVSQTRLESHVQTLQDFGTRYTYAQGNTDAGNWLYAFFESLGMQVERRAFTYGTNTEENIVARIPGRTLPGEIVVISGHFDSISEQPYASAPGADDDASAIAGVLEAAQVLRNWPFERTLEFICYNAEEQGRQGSTAIATEYQTTGVNLVAVINSDMIGYWPTRWARDLDVAYEPVSSWLADHVISASNRYVGIPIAKHLSGACRDDHYSFTIRGFSAVTNMDCWNAHNGGGETTPHYHKSTDTIETLDLGCMTDVVRVNVASIAELAGPLSPTDVVEGLSVREGPAVRLDVHPNPVGPSTTVSYALPNATPVSLGVYDVSGRLIRTLASGRWAGGEHRSLWCGDDELGHAAAAGVYYVVLQAGPQTVSRSVVLVR